MGVRDSTRERFTKRFSHRGVRYLAVFYRRPFREGLEVSLEVRGKTIRVGELGLGERALIEKLKAEIDREFSR